MARLATRGRSGLVDLVPVTFALVDTDTVVTAVDGKPKRSPRLQRLANIRDDPAVTLLADHYDDDWSTLWWVRARGRATVEEGGESFERAIAALLDRYPQYHEVVITGPAIVVDITEWRGWAASNG